MAPQIDVNFRLQAAIRQDSETSSFVAYCPTIDLYSAGRTRGDAKKALIAAAVTYVRLCYERGILDQILKSKGLTATALPGPTPLPDAGQFIRVTEHASAYDDVFDLDIPLHLVGSRQQEKQECLQ